MTVNLQQIQAAARLIEGRVVDTPCHYSRTLSRLSGAEVYLKFENLQFTSSFKDRGALVKLESLSESEKAAGVIAVSAGNHAQAVAYFAKTLGIPATIVMPRFTPNIKVENTRVFGAEVILHGDDLSESTHFAEEQSGERNLTLVHPYNDEHIIAGQGTVGLEMLNQQPELECLLVPVGGGGLIAGIAIAANAVKPDITVVGVEAERFQAVKQSLAGQSIECGQHTIAEGIAVKQPGEKTLAVIERLVSDIVLVDESDLESAILLLLELEKTVAEGAGAASLAALLQNKPRFAGKKVGLVLSGGNIDLMVLSSVIQRGLVRTRRLVCLLIDLPDVPGALADVCALLAECEANVVQVEHQRAFTNLSVRAVEVSFLLETRGETHILALLTALEKRGYHGQLKED